MNPTVQRLSEDRRAGTSGLTVYADTVPVKRDSNSLGKKLREDEPQTQWEQYLNIHIHTYIHIII